MGNLNKSATTLSSVWETTQRLPRWYLWEGGFLVVGQAGGEVPPHAHHAIQIFLSVQGSATIRTTGGDWQSGRGMIVRPDVEHSFNAGGAVGALLFVDPESAEGRWLSSALMQDITIVPDARLETCLAELRTFIEQPLASMEAADLIRHCVRAFSPGAPPTRRLDERISAVLKAVRESDDLRMSVEAAAARVHLSPGRFSHLFKEQVGLPYRRYMLWRKLTRAMRTMSRETTIAAAAHGSDFADAAHLTRTFYQMFGIPPSVMMRGEFFEIPSPFRDPAG